MSSHLVIWRVAPAPSPLDFYHSADYQLEVKKIEAVSDLLYLTWSHPSRSANNKSQDSLVTRSWKVTAVGGCHYQLFLLSTMTNNPRGGQGKGCVRQDLTHASKRRPLSDNLSLFQGKHFNNALLHVRGVQELYALLQTNSRTEGALLAQTWIHEWHRHTHIHTHLLAASVELAFHHCTHWGC